MKDKHQKHAPLATLEIGHFHKNEWAIYGTTCDNIREFATQLMESLPKLHIVFVDMDHHTDQVSLDCKEGKILMSSPKYKEWNSYDFQFHLEKYDAVIVNGNHFAANRQIVIQDDKKISSLQKRVDQLTHVDIVIQNGAQEDYGFLHPKCNDSTIFFNTIKIKNIVETIATRIKQKPSLKALILTGGKSKRMGMDKSQLVYNQGLPQGQYLANICRDLGLETFISTHHKQEKEKEFGFPTIPDTYINKGPMGGILSAFESDPNTAWLILACDLPYLDSKAINKLIQHRSQSHYATAYQLDSHHFPEPLIAIYEPRSFMRMLQFLHLGKSCPRKVLINSDVNTLFPDDAQLLHNVNTMEEYNMVIKSKA